MHTFYNVIGATIITVIPIKSKNHTCIRAYHAILHAIVQVTSTVFVMLVLTLDL